jgi:hypothetical protein
MSVAGSSGAAVRFSKPPASDQPPARTSRQQENFRRLTSLQALDARPWPQDLAALGS